MPNPPLISPEITNTPLAITQINIINLARDHRIEKIEKLEIEKPAKQKSGAFLAKFSLHNLLILILINNPLSPAIPPIDIF
ncbi:hypothetical protein ACLS0M_00360 [Avibacterium avium]